MKQIIFIKLALTLFLIPVSAFERLSGPDERVVAPEILCFSGKNLPFSASLDSLFTVSEYKKLSWRKERFHIDLLAITLQEHEGAIGVIEMWFKTPSERKELKRRAARIFRHLTEKRGTAKDRVVFNISNRPSSYKTKIWLYPKDLTSFDLTSFGCKFEDCETLKAENFVPK